MTSSELRPRDLALLLLASGDLLPRKRARDQQADVAGLHLKRRVLERVAALDPETDQLEVLLLQLVSELGLPTGPTQAIARQFLEEWRLAAASPEWLAQLLAEATQRSASDGRTVPA
jgi:hypothetical protein